VDLDAGEFSVDGKTFKEGDTLTIGGSTGRVVEGEVPLVEPGLSEDFEQVLSWSDELRTLKVRANADTPEDAKKARELGAEGIGLCRTEHMFMEDGRLEVMRDMILSESGNASEEALAELEPLQRGDFEEIFRTMDGLPVTVRLLDPPLHEFLPDSRELAEKLAARQESEDGDSEEASELRRQLRVVEGLEEANYEAAAWGSYGRRSTGCSCGPSPRRPEPQKKKATRPSWRS
jgi:pyruvate, orthophosphate dikinase